MSNTSKVAKEPKTNGFAFFSLIDRDDIIEYQGPRSRKFIPSDCGEDITDPDTMNDYIEVYGDNRSKTLNAVTDWKVIDFSVVECGERDGRISVASIDPQSGLIFVKRENNLTEEVLPIYDDELSVDDLLLLGDDDFVDEDYYLKYVHQRRMGVNEERRKSKHHKPRRENIQTMPERSKDEHRKPCRNNCKTMSDSKIHRNNRVLLAQVKNFMH